MAAVPMGGTLERRTGPNQRRFVHVRGGQLKRERHSCISDSAGSVIVGCPDMLKRAV